MTNKFYNILVPINFTTRNKWAITKAIEIANSFDCNVHFVSVVHSNISPVLPIESGIFTPYESHADRMYHYERLKQLQSKYSSQLCCRGKIEISVLEGDSITNLADYIKRYTMDLVIIGLSRFNLLHRVVSSMSIGNLARKTEIPVLGVRASGLVCHFKKIILPLHNEVSVRRIKMATMLARTFNSTIYMVTLRKSDNSAEKIINDALQIVQSLSTIPVQGIILEGKNLAKTTLQFARQINGDLIMINPLKEFNLPGWWNMLTNKLLSYASNIPVLSLGKY